MGIIDWVFPKKCLECGVGGGYFCTRCVEGIKKAKEKCPVCAQYSYGGKTHRSCGQKWGMDGVVTIYRYEGVTRKAILKLKYNFVSELTDELGLMMTNELKKSGFMKGEKVILVPVPLYGPRMRWRGFNQAAEIGKVIAREMCWNYAEILERRKATESQTGLDKKNRQKNVRGVFQINPRSGSELTASDCVVVVFDDVWTTGATMRECTEALKRGGAKEVWGLSLAS